MKVNYYFIIVGILSFLFCFTHAWNGYSQILPIFENSNLEISMKTVMLYIWHIISVENFVFGIFFFIMAFYKDQTKIKFSAIVIVTMILARWIVILISTLLKEPKNIGSTVIDSVAIIIYSGLIIIGIIRAQRINAV